MVFSLLLTALLAAISPSSIHAPASLRLQPCRVVSYPQERVSRLDSSTSSPNAVYARVGARGLCVTQCGDVFIVAAGATKTTWRPAYVTQSCYGQYPLAEQAVVVQQRYVFLLSNYDSYLSKPQVRLLRVDLHTAQVQIVDRGALNLPLAVDPAMQVLTSQKQGQLMSYRLPVAQ